MFDVFISYKSSDIEFVEKLSTQLLQKDPSVKIFYAKKSLAEIGNANYLEEIEHAIKQSKNMLVFGSKAENFISEWVKHEWRFFQHLKLDSAQGQYFNLFTVSESVDIFDLPDTLRHCENIDINNIEKIYCYIKNINQNTIEEQQFSRDVDFLDSAFRSVGWNDAILVSPTLLSQYENKITSDLKKVTIISHRLEEDTPGRAMFDTVAESLSKGIIYNYVLVKNAAAKSILRNIYFGHTESNRNNLKLQVCDFDFWTLGEYANVTIYEYKNKPTEGYFRIKTTINDNKEQNIFIRISEKVIRLIEGSIINCIENGVVQKYIPQEE